MLSIMNLYEDGDNMSKITKIALANSLKNLLRIRTLDKITIKDVVEHCGVNRQTFYYHFHDIYDLLEWSLDEDAKNIIGNKKTYTTWQEGVLQIFEYASSDKRLIQNIYNSIGREHLESYLYDLVFNLLNDVVKEKAIKLNASEENRKFVIDFYKYAFVGLLLDWIKKGMQEEAEEVVKRLTRLVKGDIELGLKKLEKDKSFISDY